MHMDKTRKMLIQCDFDGTITDEDVSFILLDIFASGDWRKLLKAYKEDKISVGRFNTEAFAMIKADKQSLLEAIKGRIKIREGFHELVDYCQGNGLRLVIVSNGQDFYIKSMLNDIGVRDITVYAAQTQFSPDGMQVRYIGPEGKELQDGFKEAYVSSFLKSGYQVIYVGNGPSDLPAAKLCQCVFATGELLTHCQKTNLNCHAFTDFHDIVRTLETL